MDIVLLPWFIIIRSLNKTLANNFYSVIFCYLRFKRSSISSNHDVMPLIFQSKTISSEKYLSISIRQNVLHSSFSIRIMVWNTYLYSSWLIIRGKILVKERGMVVLLKLSRRNFPKKNFSKFFPNRCFEIRNLRQRFKTSLKFWCKI